MIRFIATILLLIAPLVAHCQQKPRLVVNITVAGLRYDYLLKFSKAFNNWGIKRLMQEGHLCTQTSIDYFGSTTPVSVATIACGSTPSSHGIIGTHWFDYTTEQIVRTLYDRDVLTLGEGTLDAQVSPRNLTASTIGDCIKDLSPTSKVISIATTPTSAVIAGGHLADGCYWISPRNGEIVTSTYYTSKLPQWVDTFNSKDLATAYCSQKWIQSRRADQYYNVLRKDIENNKAAASEYSYQRLNTTPAGASLLKDFAVQTIIAENLGKDASTDYLTITIESPATTAAMYGPSTMETEDVIYRLDDEISTLLSFLENNIGKQHVLVIFNGANGTSEMVNPNGKIPGGLFNPDQFEILINGFLGAQLTTRLSEEQRKRIEGDTRWVLDFTDRQLYLNRKKIFDAGLSLGEVQNMVADFAIQFRGVASAITSTSLSSGDFSWGINGMIQKSYFARHSGDVVINLLPGWIVEEPGVVSNTGSPYIYDTHVPLIFWGGVISPKSDNRPSTLQDIAPTITNILGVTSPNTTTGKSIIVQ